MSAGLEARGEISKPLVPVRESGGGRVLELKKGASIDLSKASWDQLQDREMEPRPPGKLQMGKSERMTNVY